MDGKLLSVNDSLYREMLREFRTGRKRVQTVVSGGEVFGVEDGDEEGKKEKRRRMTRFGGR